MTGRGTRPESFQNHRNMYDFGLSGPSCEASRRPLGGLMGRLGVIIGVLERSLGVSGTLRA
eukprot:2767299-Pyramimonas_sp.AAC.1